MQLRNSIAIAAVAALVAAAPAMAQTGAKGGSADTNTMKAKCAAGDPNVLTDVKTKTYVMDSAANKGATASKATNTNTSDANSVAGATAAQTSGVAAGASGSASNNGAKSSDPATTAQTSGVAAGSNAVADNGATMSSMKSMCRSDAESMGAHMTPGTGMQK